MDTAKTKRQVSKALNQCRQYIKTADRLDSKLDFVKGEACALMEIQKFLSGMTKALLLSKRQQSVKY